MEPVIRICLYCNKEFTVKPDEPGHPSRQDKKYCRKQHSDAAKKKRRKERGFPLTHHTAPKSTSGNSVCN